MGLSATVSGKVQAATRLAEFVRYLRNWPEVWSAYRQRAPLPALRLRGGMEIVGSPQDDLCGIFQEVFVHRCYTRRFYRPQPGDMIIDIGANIGIFTTFLYWLTPGVRVHCFEPASATRDRLDANLVRNRLAGSVGVHPLAVGAGPGQLTLQHGATAGHTSAIPSEFTGATSETVECIDLAGALERCGGGQVALLKIDTEGAEVDILRSAPRDLPRLVERVVVEYHGCIRPGAREATREALLSLGYPQIEDVPDLPDGELGLLRASR